VCLLSCLLCVVPAFAQRLPQTVLPDHYQITLAPDLKAAKFSGEETIEVRLLAATAIVTLNSAEIEFQEADITAGGKTQKADVSLDPKLEQATLTVADALPAGPATIHIKFTGTLNDQLRGFYLVTTATRRYAATQFEATDARRAFPCFDEPAMKATFSLRLIVDAGDTAISNNPIATDAPGPGEGKHTLTFSTTPKMSSYLVAMAVGDFECAEGSADGVPIRVCATPGHQAMTGFALEAAGHILHYYDQYYGIKYPYAKLDLVAVPDFAAGAMENTAAIFFREGLLLVDREHTSSRARREVASVIAHEMAHMWFGDLVTMQWWNDLWLNEGFATWMAPKPLQAWNAEWRADEDAVQETIGAMNTDSYQATHAVRTQADTPNQILELADEITYGKAADVLRMVEAYVGPETFRRGVNAYLKDHAYGNAMAEDFWNTMTRVSGKPVDEIMKSFVDQPGVPAISVEFWLGGGRTQVKLSQHRFFYSQGEFNAPSGELWTVPVCIKGLAAESGSEAGVRCELLDSQEKVFTYPGYSSWLDINAGARGYYRSIYSSPSIGSLSNQVAGGELSSPERLMFVADGWSAVRAGQLGIGEYLQSLESFQSEDDPAVMARIGGILRNIDTDIAVRKDAEPFHAWVRSFLGLAARELGWNAAPGETDDRKSLRETVLYTLGYVGRDPETLAKARTVIEAYMKDPTAADPGLATACARMAASVGDTDLYNQYLAHTQEAHAPEEYQRFLYSLAEFPDTALLTRTVELALSPAVRIQTAPFLIAAVLSNPAGRPATWNYVKAHWAAVSKRIPDFAAGSIVYAAGDVCDAGSREDVDEFLAGHPLTSAERTLREADERMSQCIDLRAQQAPKLASWLKVTTRTLKTILVPKERNSPSPKWRSEQF
jgi:aminopeptidase N